MSDIKLTGEETPLHWPITVPITDLKTCSSCGIRVIAPNPGSLQINSRLQGSGVGDGVNIEESIQVSADYRGQRYKYDEAIFHAPGLHVFPNQTAVYPAEYHVHFSSISEPLRFITLVIPISHNVEGPEKTYFMAFKRVPDPSAKRPTLESLLSTLGGPVIQYQGPNIRGRVYSSATPPKTGEERQFLLIQKVASIRASDLERIPSLDGTQADSRFLPARGVEPKIKAISRDRLVRTAVLATPGLLYATPTAVATTTATTELECKPLKVVNGRDVVDISGKAVDLRVLLGISDAPGSETTGTITDPTAIVLLIVNIFAIFIGFYIGILISDQCWKSCFNSSARLEQWEPLKIWLLPSMFAMAVYFSS